jgi:hypothetical protein
MKCIDDTEETLFINWVEKIIKRVGEDQFSGIRQMTLTFDCKYDKKDQTTYVYSAYLTFGKKE